MSLGTTPSVEGAKARAQALYRALLYTLGCVAGGAAMAVAISSAAGFTSRWLWLVLAGGAGLLLPVVAMRASAAMGGRCWQVPKAWWRRLGDLAFVPAGATLTSGVFTPIIFPSFWILLLLFAALDWRWALAAGAAFGVLRSADNWRSALSRPTLQLENPYAVFVERRGYVWRLVRGSLLVAGSGALGLAIALAMS